MNPDTFATTEIRRAERLLLAGLVLGLFCLYALSASRTVALEDDGEFIVAGYVLGIAHPPGYPVHTLLAFLFSHVPIGSVAWRVHVLSGMFGALAAGLVYLCLRRLAARPLAAGTAALALGLSEVFWSQSIIAEVYTLHLFLFALMWLLSLRIHQGDARPGHFLGLAGAAGLALANHWPLTVLAGPSLLLLVWPHWKALLGWRVLAVGAVAVAAPYAWLVFRSQQDPLISFYGPLRSLGDFWYFVTREGFVEVDHKPYAGTDDRLKFASFVANDWARQFTLGGAVLALLGLAWLWKRQDRAIGASLGWSVLAVSALLVTRLDFEYFAQSKAAFRVYPLTAYLGSAILLGCGLEAVARWLARHGRVRHGTALIAIVLAVTLAASNSRANWRRDDDWAAAYARAILEETPPDAILVTHSDWTALPLAYAHFVEGHCPGCQLFEANGLLYPSRVFEPLRTPPEARARRVADYLSRVDRPVAYTGVPPPGVVTQDRWLVRIAGALPEGAPMIRISPRAHDFFRRHVIDDDVDDATVRTVQQDLRRHYLFLFGLGGAVPATGLDSLCLDFHGCLGLVEGMLTRPDRYAAADVELLLARIQARMPGDAHRWDRARVLELRGLLLARTSRKQEALLELQAAIRLAPDATVSGRRTLAELGVETELVPRR